MGRHKNPNSIYKNPDKLREYNRVAKRRERGWTQDHRKLLWMALAERPGATCPEIGRAIGWPNIRVYGRLLVFVREGIAIKQGNNWFALHSAASAEVFGIDDPRFFLSGGAH